MLAIVNASEDDYNKLSTAIYNSKDAAQDMADTMMDTIRIGAGRCIWSAGSNPGGSKSDRHRTS